MTAVADSGRELTRKDFTSDQEVRWCPGCGDYAILAGIQRLLPELGVPPEQIAFVSGIGCAARFPYYMGTYGFHTIHGRAPAVATGLKLGNPELDVWVITGDGDALSIGGNHTLHVLRRDVDLQMLLFNNEIYGLTKGQYSPTSVVGQQTPSTPMGSIDPPVNAASYALGAGGRFVARTLDTDQKHLPQVLRRAHGHRGAAFVEIFQNCNVFNDRAFAHFTDKKVAADRQLRLEHGEPMVFGAQRDKALRVTPGTVDIEVVDLHEDGVGMDEVLVHDERNRNLASMLARLAPPDFPAPLGVLYADPAETTYERSVHGQIAQARQDKGPGELNALLRSGYTWRVE